MRSVVNPREMQTQPAAGADTLTRDAQPFVMDNKMNGQSRRLVILQGALTLVPPALVIVLCIALLASMAFGLFSEPISPFAFLGDVIFPLTAAAGCRWQRKERGWSM